MNKRLLLLFSLFLSLGVLSSSYATQNANQKHHASRFTITHVERDGLDVVHLVKKDFLKKITISQRVALNNKFSVFYDQVAYENYEDLLDHDVVLYNASAYFDKLHDIFSVCFELSDYVPVVALMILETFLENNQQSISLNRYTYERLWLTALVLAAKSLEDHDKIPVDIIFAFCLTYSFYDFSNVNSPGYNELHDAIDVAQQCFLENKHLPEKYHNVVAPIMKQQGLFLSGIKYTFPIDPELLFKKVCLLAQSSGENISVDVLEKELQIFTSFAEKIGISRVNSFISNMDEWFDATYWFASNESSE
jgi:hypothetical protein